MRQPRRSLVIHPYRNVPPPTPAASPARLPVLVGQSEMDLGREESEYGERQKNEETEDGRRRRGVAAVEKEDEELTDTIAAGQSAVKYDLCTVIIVVFVVTQLADLSWTTS